MEEVSPHSVLEVPPSEANPTPANRILVNGRFVASDLRYEANGARTYFGHDAQTQQKVVIKVVSRESVTTGAYQRLKHEASVLRQLSSPALVSPLAFSAEGDHVFLVSPFVPGITLKERLERGPLKVSETIHVARALFSALREAHAHLVFHCDIKPSNIIVAESVLSGEVKLIDFGFARSVAGRPDGDGGRQRALPGGEKAFSIEAGTIRYMSPEQTGSLRLDVDERADLYSAGVVLYECLTGACPFDGETIGEVLRKHLTLKPRRLRESLSLPRVLDEILERLLNKDPRDRYQTAEGVLADFVLLADAIERDEKDPSFPLGRSDRRRTLTEPSFIGRRPEMERLSHWWHETREGRGGLVLVEAESGGGKTRFLEEFAREILTEQGVVYWGQGLDQAAQRPFQLLVGVAEGIVQRLFPLPEEGHALRARLGSQREAASQALPELKALLRPEDETVLGPEGFGENRNLLALTTLFDALGTPGSPVCVILDDGQWSDEAALKWLQHWQRTGAREGAGPRHVLVVVAFRSEEVPLGHVLRRARPKEALVLPPFGDKEVAEMVASMAGTVPGGALDLVVRLSGGSPFMTSATVRGLVESGTLVPDRSGWRLEEAQLAELTSSRFAGSVLARRIALLPPHFRELLCFAAVLGKEFHFEFAAMLSGQTADEAWAAVEEARHRHMVWPLEKSGHYAFVHDKVREALLGGLSPETRRRYHLAAARRLLETSPGSAFELAYHFDAAGDSRSALPFALTAAERARAQHSLQIALEQYRIAERGNAGGDLEFARRIAAGLGDVFLLRGEYESARRQFEHLLALTEDPLERASIRGKLGEVAFKRGDVEAASRATEEALRSLGGRVPRTNWQFLLMALWEAWVQVLHTLFPRLFVARRPLARASRAELLSMRLCSRLAYIYWFQRGKVPCAWAHLREMNLAERYPPTPELAQAYSEHAPVMTMIPYFSRGIRYAEKGLAIRRSLGDLWGQGQSLHFYGVALYGASRYEECIEKCREALRVLERTGDRWEVNTANWHIAFCLYRLGELGSAVELSRLVHQAGIEIHDHQATGISLSSWSRASGGRVPAELVRSALAEETGDAHTRVEVLVAEGVRLLKEAQPEAAIQILTRARATIRRAGLHQEYIAPVYPWLVTALRVHAEASHGATPRRFRFALRALRGPVRESLRISRQYRNNLPHALREAGLVAALEGKMRRAKRCLNASCSIAEKQGARHELAQSLEARGRVGGELGWPSAEQDLALSARLFLEMEREVREETKGGRAYDLSISDRFDLLLEAGRRLTSALTTESVYEAVRESALKLLRGERCHVFALDARLCPVPALATEREEEAPSADLLQRALAAAAPVAWVEGAKVSASESIVLKGLRSVLCAPLFVRGKPAGCFYVVHRRVGALFGEEEKRLAEFIAILGGVALENAAGFAELEALSESRKADLLAIGKAQAELKLRAEELARSNDDLQRFAYVASHDLKEPLRMVSSYVRLLERRYKPKLDEDAGAFIGYAVEGVTRMYHLIDALLDYSRVSMQPAEHQPVSLDEVMSWVMTTLRLALTEHEAVVEWDPLPTVLADRTQMQQLFQNLIGNALKFRGEGPPRVHVSCQKTDEGWRFSVRDNGIGIQPEHAEQIFVIFKRLHRRSEYPGTGVGLAICKRIIDVHRGRIWVESEPGVGSDFRFVLPADGPRAGI